VLIILAVPALTSCHDKGNSSNIIIIIINVIHHTASISTSLQRLLTGAGSPVSVLRGALMASRTTLVPLSPQHDPDLPQRSQHPLAFNGVTERTAALPVSHIRPNPIYTTLSSRQHLWVT